jgi:cytochrome P450
MSDSTSLMPTDPGRAAPLKPADLLRDGSNLSDIHSHFDWLRTRAPVLEMTIQEYFGLPKAANYENEREFSVFSYEACREVFVDQARFSARAYSIQHDKKMGEATILSMDDPEHRQRRDLVSAGFFAKAIESWASETIPSIANDILDALPPEGGSADFVAAFTHPLPIQVIVGIVGTPREDWPRLLAIVDAITNFSAYPVEGAKAAAAAQQYVTEIVQKRRRSPKNDLASTLAVAEVEGKRLTDAAIVAFLIFLLAAGGETTVRGLGTLISALLAHPEQLDALRRDRSLVKPAIEEAFRWDPPVVQLRRMATRDTELCGVTIPAGAQLAVLPTAANRDPSRWANPERFDIRRDHKAHLTFGAGPHYCIGVHLAKREVEAALDAFLDRVENPRFTHDPPPVEGLLLRGPRQLWLTYDRLKPRKI